MLGEFDLIKRFFLPLATGPGLFELGNDAALLSPSVGCELVCSSDMLIESVHFFGEDAPGAIAQKALRVNLSDLAAMGARPVAYSLNLALPNTVDERWLAAFTAGLAEDQATYGCYLLGGDTTKSPQGLVISISVFGEVEKGQALTRSGAQPGDRLYVSGPVGLAALGLQIRLGRYQALPEQIKERALEAYLFPKPARDLGLWLAGKAHACLDVSDGLLADAGHIASRSAVTLELQWPSMILPEFEALREERPGLREQLLSGGDDYQLLFALPNDLSLPSEFGAIEVGRVLEGAARVKLLDRDGAVIPFENAGWKHF